VHAREKQVAHGISVRLNHHDGGHLGRLGAGLLAGLADQSVGEARRRGGRSESFGVCARRPGAER
jgi:hypothetical protein